MPYRLSQNNILINERIRAISRPQIFIYQRSAVISVLSRILFIPDFKETY